MLYTTNKSSTQQTEGKEATYPLGQIITFHFFIVIRTFWLGLSMYVYGNDVCKK